MGFKHKKTDEVLDRIVQIIWHYQQTHNNETPTQQFIFNELVEGKLLNGNSPSSMTWYTRLLIDDDRIEKISSRPFRVTIRQHPKNRSAILRASRALEAQAALEAKPVVVPDAVLHPDSDVIVCDVEPAVLKETAEKLEAAITGTPEPGPEPEPTQYNPPPVNKRSPHSVFSSLPEWASYRGPMNWNELDQLVRSLGGDLSSIATQFVMSTAKPGDLLEQLLDRGYTVSKTNPRWRD